MGCRRFWIDPLPSKDYEEKEGWETKPNIGLDAKIGIGSALNLDLTVNPDFSQIEIDEQIVNLTRFDVQLPEKRTFFLENGDLFSNFGIPPIRPFFSRTIGLDSDGAPLPILGGLRLTGNLNADTRIGLMTMLTGKQGDTPARENTALAANYRVFGRSTVSGYFLDRAEFNDSGELQKKQFSRNAGIELGFTSLNGKWSSWLTHHRSFKPEIASQNWWGNSGFQYRVRGFSWLTDFTHMGENYYADLGFEARIENYDFVRDTTLRIGYNFWFNNLSYQIFPKNKGSNLNFIEIGAEFFQVFNPNGSFNESSNSLDLELNFKNTSTQADNFNVNSRFQWRFRPMSDLFVVYTDNYAVEVFGVKNRAMTAKLNWWF